jgi:5-methylcytosine-specific restriction protein A
MYQIGALYSRKDLYESLAIPFSKQGGDWLNGYHRHGSDYYIFCNIGLPGRTGHDYPNQWDGDRLIWHGKGKSHFNQMSIRDLISKDFRVFVFYRADDRAPFTFAGIGNPLPHLDSKLPVRIDWVFSSDESEIGSLFTDEYAVGAKHNEGQRIQVLVSRYERDRKARDECIRYYGVKCQVCEIDFQQTYGDDGKGFIHVHHLTPLSKIAENYVVDPIRDMIPLCPNCHAMIHRRNPPLSIDDLKKLFSSHLAEIRELEVSD